MALSDNLQGWWCPSLDTAGNGTTTLTDLSGNGNNGTLTNMDAATDWVADTDSGGVRGLSVTQATEKIVIPNLFNPATTAFSVNCWCKIDTLLAGGLANIILQQDAAGGRSWMYADDRPTSFLSGTTTYFADADMPEGQWVCLTLTYDLTTLRTYFNGSLYAAVSRTVESSTGDLLYGNHKSGVDNQPVNGLLDGLAIYNRVLTADDAVELYNGGRSLRLTNLSTGLQGWWCPSLDTAGNGTTTLTDLSGNGNNGTLTNMDAATDWVADTDSGGVRALDLDGLNDAVSLPTIPVASLQTVAAWVKFAALPATLTLAFSSRDPMRLYLGQFNSTGYIRVGSDSGSLGGSVSLSTTEWFHFVAVTADDGLSYSGYINGVSVGSRATTLSATTAVGLGAYFVIPTQPVSSFLSGLLDSVAVYSRALTADEVTQLYNGGRSLNLLATGTGNIAHVLRSIQQQHESMVVL